MSIFAEAEINIWLNKIVDKLERCSALHDTCLTCRSHKECRKTFDIICLRIVPPKETLDRLDKILKTEMETSCR